MSEYYDRAARLKKARIDRGFKTARLAAEYFGIPYGTYSGHENGSRGIKEPELLNYAKVFRVNLSWLAFGDLNKARPINISGVVGGPDAVSKDSLKRHLAKDITPPFPVPGGVTALLVVTDDCAPYLRENDIVLVGERTNTKDQLNQRVALSVEGITFIGTLLSAAKANHFHLQSFNGQVKLDIKPTWVAPIIGILHQT